MSEPELTFWSRSGASWDDTALTRQFTGEPLAFDTEGGRFQAGRLSVPHAGVLALEVVSPRPIRLWVAGLLVLDEALSWRSFQREVRAAVLVPVAAAGEVSLRVEVGERPRHPANVDRDCPSRNRERSLAEVERLHPDSLGLTARVVEGATCPPLSLRFSPGQFVREGVTYQHVLVRHASSTAGGAPSTRLFWPTDAAPEALALSSSVLPGHAEEGTDDADRRAGLRRFYVPVANPFDAPAPLRAPGDPEARPEPAQEIARTLELKVNGIPVAMPAYESLGRNAPRREFAPTEWPEWGPALRDRLPRPVLPAEWSRFGELYDAAWAMLLARVRTPRPDSGLPDRYVSTGPGFRDYQFVWDSSFTAMCTAYGHAAGVPPYGTLDLLYTRQFDGGYLHREHDIRDGTPVMYEPDFSPNPPLLSVAEWQIASLTGDALRLHRVFRALAEQHEWLRANRRLPDGTYWTTGLANGLDNSPSLGDGYPDLTAQLAHDAEILANIAGLLGDAAGAEAYRAHRDAIGQALNERLFDEEAKIYSTSLPGGGHNKNKVVTAFWPLWAGIVPPGRTEWLALHAQDPKSFGRHHPFPSLAADSPEFVPGGDYWRGSVWAPTTYAAVKGFARAGKWEVARDATRQHLAVLHEVWAATGHLWENYSSEPPSRPGSTSQPDYCWTALGPIALLFEVLLGFEPDALNDTLRWRVPDSAPRSGPVGVRNYPLGRAHVSVLRDSGGRISVETDRPFVLEVTPAKGGEARRVECPAGTTRLTL